MGKTFNENSRVKIPAILHLTRLQYKYVSLQQVEQQIDSETNIYKESFRVSLNQINGIELTDKDVGSIISDLKNLLDAEDLGMSFYEKFFTGIAFVGGSIRLIDFENLENNIFEVMTEVPYRNGADSFRPDITIFVNGLPLAFVEVKIPDNKQGIQDDTLLNPRHLNLQQNNIATFDYVVSNPPFNMDFSETRDTLAGDSYRARFFAGVPNTPNKKKDGMAIYQLFLQHIIKSMNEHGKAAVVVPTGFLTASTGIALKIRQHIINEKILRGVVSMPSNIFANTGTNVSVVFLDADGSNKTLLVDASNLGTKQKIEGTKNQRTYLSDDEINLIIDTFNKRQEVEDFSTLVSLDDIAQKNFSFSAGQYFKVKIEYVELSPEEFQAKMQGFQSDLQKFFDEGHQLERDILQQLENLSYEEN